MKSGINFDEDEKEHNKNNVLSFLVVFNCHALENLIKTIGFLKPRISEIKEYKRLRRMRSKMCSRLAGLKFFRKTTKASRR